MPSFRHAYLIDAEASFGDPAHVERSMRDLAASGLTAISVTVGLVGNGSGRFQSILDDVSRIDGWFDVYRATIMPVQRASDLRSAKRRGATGVVLNVQDTAALEGDVSRIALLKSLGIRIVQLTYNKRNLAGDGCLESADAGISDFGRNVISEINRHHLLLDLSHGGARTIAQAASLSTAPPAVTHTGCRALVNNQRNLWDGQMRQIAERGGVVGIYLIAYLRSGIGQVARNARGADLIRHLEHAANVCGEDHVGIGTDGGISALVIDAQALAAQKERFEARVRDGVATAGEGPDVFNYVPEYNSPQRFLTLADDLARRNWPARRIDKLIGGNFARLFSEVWDA